MSPVAVRQAVRLALRPWVAIVTVVSLVLFACALNLSPAQAESVESIPNPLKARKSWVADSAEVLDAATEARINNLLSPLARNTGAEVAVVTVRTLDGLTIEEFANQLFRHWGIGKKGEDRGVLIIGAVGDRRLRIEVGYGLEGEIPDSKAAQIIATTLKPAFREKRYGDGMWEAALAVARSIDPDAKVPAPAVGKANPPVRDGAAAPGSARPPSERWPPLPTGPQFDPVPEGSRNGSSSAGPALFGAFLLLLGLGSIGAAIWFLGRLFGPRKCPRCRAAMRELSPAEEPAHLSAAQQFEQRIGSVDYKVWQCPSCAYEEAISHKRLFASHDSCPRCRNRTLRINRVVEQEPTQWAGGMELVTKICEWPECGYTDSYRRTLAPLPREQANTRSGVDLATGMAIGSILTDAANSHSRSHNDHGSYGGSDSGSSYGSSSSYDSSPSYDSGPSDFGGGDSGGGGASDSY